MTTIEYMVKQVKRHKINLYRETQHGASEEVLNNISAKIACYEEAIEALKKMEG